MIKKEEPFVVGANGLDTDLEQEIGQLIVYKYE